MSPLKLIAISMCFLIVGCTHQETPKVPITTNAFGVKQIPPEEDPYNE